MCKSLAVNGRQGNTFGRVHGTAAAQGNQRIMSARLEHRDTRATSSSVGLLWMSLNTANGISAWVRWA
jgi:hypothetical protein